MEVLACVDARRICRIVRNLLANAIDFAEGRPVEVRLAVNRAMVVISVRDYGVGMTTSQCERIFDRFWRGDPSRARTTGGTGLGMAIVLADVRLHGGDISVRSQMGKENGPVNVAQAPIRFSAENDGFCTVGGFGIADNGFSDYLTGEPNVGKGRKQ